MLDIVLNDRSTQACDGSSRRDFLRIGSLGLAGPSEDGSASQHKRWTQEQHYQGEVGRVGLPGRRHIAPR
jgi:hypothetical protein